MIRRLALLTVALTLAPRAGASPETLPAADGPGGIAAVKAWARARLPKAEQAFKQSGLKRMASPGYWGDAIVYQIQVDRFNNGDPSNDSLNLEDHQAEHQAVTQKGLAGYRHGGDLKGIRDRLDYLADLGVTALWITPVFKHNGSYHGYCVTDFTQVDPGFGTNEELRDLVAAAHARGIRVVLDIVVNHLCDRGTRYDDAATPFQDWAYGLCVSDLDRGHWTGQTEVRGRRRLVFGPGLFPPLRHETFFSRCGFKPGDFAGHGPGALFGDFSREMFDLDTLNWDFQDIFTDLHKWWIAYADVDGFRLDAAKHVTADFIARFSSGIRDYAASLGKLDFFLVGEIAGAPFEQAIRLGLMRGNVHDPWDPSTNTPAALRARMASVKPVYERHPVSRFPGLNAVYDFAHSGRMAETWRHTSTPLRIKQWFYDGAETDHRQCQAGYCELKGNADPRLNWNVLEIHDWPRFALWGAGEDRMIGAAANLLFTQGIPVLYYGYEQGLNGICRTEGDRLRVLSQEARDEILRVCQSADVHNHSRFRQDMFASGPWRLGSAVPAVDALAGIGFAARTAPGSDPYLRTDHDLFRSIRRFAAIRRSCGALRRGEIYFRAAHDAAGLLAFSRIDGATELVVLLNTSGQRIPVRALHVDAAINSQDFEPWRNLLNGGERAWTGALGIGKGIHFEDGFSVGPYSVAIFAKERELGAYDERVGALTCAR